MDRKRKSSVVASVIVAFVVVATACGESALSAPTGAETSTTNVPTDPANGRGTTVDDRSDDPTAVGATGSGDRAGGPSGSSGTGRDSVRTDVEPCDAPEGSDGSEASPTLLVFDVATGALLWQRCATERSFGGLAAEAGGAIIDWAAGDGTRASPMRSTGSDPTTGATLWQFETDTIPGGFGGDTLYISGEPVDDEPPPIVALDAASGRERWRSVGVTAGDWFGLNGIAPTYILGVAPDGSVVALDSQTGLERWRMIGVRPVAARDDVVIMDSLTEAPDIVAVRADTGAELWRGRSGGIATVTDDELVVWPLAPKRNGEPVTTTFIAVPVGGTAPPLPDPADYTTTMEVWSLADGTLVREIEVPGESGLVGMPSMMQTQGRPEDLAVAQSDETSVIDLGTGDLLWSRTSSPRFMAADDRVVIISEDPGRFTVFDTGTGDIRWEFEVPCFGGGGAGCVASRDDLVSVALGPSTLIVALGNAAG